MWPSLKTITCIPFRNLGLGYFIMVNPIDAKLYHVWIGKEKNDVVKGVNSLNFFKIFIFHVGAIEKRN